MELSPHFDSAEFEKDGDPLPTETIPMFADMCVKILEPLRAQFNEPWYTDSGYRSAVVNKRIGGVANSQHVATANYCAVDGFFESYRKDMRSVFDWLRQSNLPFDQCILEHGKYGDIIHLSISKMPRREALEGATFNASGYKSWPVTSA